MAQTFTERHSLTYKITIMKFTKTFVFVIAILSFTGCVEKYKYDKSIQDFNDCQVYFQTAKRQFNELEALAKSQHNLDQQITQKEKELTRAAYRRNVVIWCENNGVWVDLQAIDKAYDKGGLK